MELDPAFNDPLLHLIDIAAVEQDRAGLDALTSELRRRDLDDEYKTAFQAARAYMLGERSPPEIEVHYWVLIGTVARLLTLWGDLQGAEEAARPMISSDRPAGVQVAGHANILTLLSAQGKLDEAREESEKIAGMNSDAYLWERGRLATLPFLSQDEREQEERRLLEQLSAWDSENITFRAGRLYFIGLLRAETGDASGALEAAARLWEMEAPERFPSLTSDFARGVEAEVHLREGEQEQALQQLEALKLQGDANRLYALYSGARERFLRAKLLFEAGRLEDALAWYETLEGYAPEERSYLGPAHFGRARVLEALGRTKEAAEAYERFLDLWKEADPAFESMVEEARERFGSLTKEGVLASTPGR